MKSAIMTVDVEYDWETKESKSIDLILPKILDIFDDRGIKATFFVVTSLVDEYEDLIKDIASKHEVASHSHTHKDLTKLSEEELDNEIILSLNKLKEIGVETKGFRAPKFVVSKHLGKVLVKHGLVYDTSLNTSFFPGRYFNWIPNKPYKASKMNLRKKGDDIIELPIPSFTLFRFPSSGLSYYRLCYPLSKMFSKNFYMTYLHPFEFMHSVSESPMDPLVRLAMSRNCGKKAFKIFDDFLDRFNFKWVGCFDHIKSQGLL